MAIAYDAVSNNGEATGATSSTWSHTVGASLSNSLLVVSIATRDGSNSDQLATGVTYGGVALTRAGFAQYTGGPPIRAELWYLKNPTAGAANIVASFTGTVDHMSCGATSYSGVDQVIPFVNNIGIQAATGAGDVSIAVQTIVANAWTIDVAYDKTSSDMTIDGSRTSRWQLSPNTNGDRAASGTYNGIVTPADTTHTWATNPDDDFAYIVGVLRPSGVYSSGVDLISESAGRGSGSSRTFSHTIPSGFSNTILIVGVSAQDSNHANMPITGITFNGVALTKTRHDEATGNNRTELWYLKNPDVTTANVVITATGTLGELTGFALGFCNVDQTSPIDANNGGTGTSGDPSVSLTTGVANAWTVAICSAEERFRHHGTQAARAGGPLTDQTYENAMIATKFVPTAGATALGFGILSSQSYAESTLSLKPASATATYSITKSLKYTVVKAITAITKSLKYTVKTTPSTITKTLRYFVNKAGTVTKSLKYTVIKAITLTKSLKYTVRVTPATITKSLKYGVLKSYTLTKQLIYKVQASASAVTKSLKYAVIKSLTVTKSLKYTVTTTASAITKSLKYTVLKATTITKSLTYVVVSAVTYEITKSLRYTIIKTYAITKSLRYFVTSPATITKALKYAVLKSITLTKSLKYAVNNPGVVTKQLVYKVITSGLLTKSLTYGVSVANTLTKSLKYAVLKATTLTKSLTYSVVNNGVIQRTLRYRVIAPHTITLSTTYRVITSGVITKSLRYVVYVPRGYRTALPTSRETRPLDQVSGQAVESNRRPTQLQTYQAKTIL